MQFLYSYLHPSWKCWDEFLFSHSFVNDQKKDLKQSSPTITEDSKSEKVKISLSFDGIPPNVWVTLGYQHLATLQSTTSQVANYLQTKGQAKCYPLDTAERGNSKCKGTEMGAPLACSSYTKETSVAAAKRVGRRAVRQEIRLISGIQRWKSSIFSFTPRDTGSLQRVPGREIMWSF
jgi:hypothetical protein